MHMIEIAPLDNGAHRNQSYSRTLPSGWAVIREDIHTLENFPFGEVEVEEIDGLLVMTKWTPGEIPEPTPEPEPAPVVDLQAELLERVLDQELRLAALEQGV